MNSAGALVGACLRRLWPGLGAVSMIHGPFPPLVFPGARLALLPELVVRRGCPRGILLGWRLQGRPTGQGWLKLVNLFILSWKLLKVGECGKGLNVDIRELRDVEFELYSLRRWGG